jgi:hypothetical protein
MINYNVNLPRNDYKVLKDNAIEDLQYKNGSKLKLVNKKKYFYLHVFDQLISNYEETKVRLAPKNGAINTKATRKDANLMRINSSCKLCHSNCVNNTYRLVIKTFPEDKRADIVVHVERDREHSHTGKTSDDDDEMDDSSEPANQQAIVNTNKRQRTNDDDEDEIEASESLVVKENIYKFRKVRLEG